MAIKTLKALAALVMIAGASDLASAQTTPPASDNAANVSATGKHMPGVGASKSAGVTPFDKKLERKMQKETTICKGC